MSKYVEQVKHNETLHLFLQESKPDHYFDWKITCLFYCAYHLMQALALHKGVKIGNTHSEIFKNINPKFPNRSLQIKKDVFEAYDDLFEYSQTARYDGFLDMDTFQALKKADYGYAKRAYEYVKKYVLEQGVKF